MTKLIVTASLSKSKRLKAILGLGIEWRPIAFGDALSKTYDEAFVIWPLDGHPMYQAWFDDVLKVHVGSIHKF